MPPRTPEGGIGLAPRLPVAPTGGHPAASHTRTIPARNKRPLMGKGYRSAPAERVAHAWETATRRYGDQVQTGVVVPVGMVVIDVDGRRGGGESWSRLIASGVVGAEPTWTDRTPDGLHVWFAVSESALPVKSGHVVGHAGIEVKAAGSFVICPPTAGYTMLERGSDRTTPATITTALERLLPVRIETDVDVDAVLAQIERRPLPSRIAADRLRNGDAEGLNDHTPSAVAQSVLVHMRLCGWTRNEAHRALLDKHNTAGAGYRRRSKTDRRKWLKLSWRKAGEYAAEWQTKYRALMPADASTDVAELAATIWRAITHPAAYRLTDMSARILAVVLDRIIKSGTTAVNTSVRGIAEAASRSKSHAHRGLAQLDAAGWSSIERRGSGRLATTRTFATEEIPAQHMHGTLTHSSVAAAAALAPSGDHWTESGPLRRCWPLYAALSGCSASTTWRHLRHALGWTTARLARQLERLASVGLVTYDAATIALEPAPPDNVTLAALTDTTGTTEARQARHAADRERYMDRWYYDRRAWVRARQGHAPISPHDWIAI